MTTHLIRELSIYSILLPLLTGLVFFRFQEANARIMILLLAFASLPQLATVFLEKGSPLKIALYNLYILADASLWGYLFLRNIKSPIIKKSVVVIITIQVLVTVYFFYTAGVDQHFFSELVCLNSLIQLIWVLFFFYQRYQSEQIERLEHQSMFWFCLGILLYAPSTYFLFAFYPIIKSRQEYGPIWTAHHFLNTLMYLLFTFGFFVNINLAKKKTRDDGIS